MLQEHKGTESFAHVLSYYTQCLAQRGLGYEQYAPDFR
jgi:hypothetical protein